MRVPTVGFLKRGGSKEPPLELLFRTRCWSGNCPLLGDHAAHVDANPGKLRPEDTRGDLADHAADRHRHPHPTEA
jgi:hypothetical protein